MRCVACATAAEFFFIRRFHGSVGDKLVIINIQANYTLNTSRTDMTFFRRGCDRVCRGACVLFFISPASKKFVKHSVQKIQWLHLIKCTICHTAAYVICLCWVFKRDSGELFFSDHFFGCEHFCKVS